MEAWLEEFLQVWESSIDDLAQILLAAFERDPSQRGKWDLDTLRQLQQGGVAMMRAEYHGQGAEVREAYLQSVIPGLADQGVSLADTCATTIVVAMRIYPLIVSRVSPEHRERVGDHLCHCYGRFMHDEVRIGLELGAKA